MNKPFALCIGLLLLAGVGCQTTNRSAADRPVEPPHEPRLLEAKKIWDGAPHNAFTDLVWKSSAWFCVFREGSAHIPGTDGKIRVLRSEDGAKWESAALIAEKAIDLRDPKISIMPDGRLMIVMGGSVYAGEEPTPNRKRTSAWSRVSFSSDGVSWSAPQKIQGVGDNTWLWRVTWHKGVGYGAVYSTEKQGAKRIFTVWSTTDGINYRKIADPKPGIDLSEATIRFLSDDTMVVLLRGEEKDRHAWVGMSRPPFAQWQWKDGGKPAQGPNFIVMRDDRMFYGGRDFFDKQPKTVLGTMTADALTPVITFPSGGDCSYPGIVDAGGGVLWVSYYSAHEGKDAIYLAKVAVGGR